jgi:hypothetical protein
MPFLLTASVGIRGVNRSWDVLFVQDALNNVPTSQGGPTPALVLDGLCGPKTKAAIQQFQLHHFGWRGADGLVEVGKQTHEKLNQYWKKPEGPPPPPTPQEPKSTSFVITTTHRKEVFGADRRDWFFEIRSVPYNAVTRYYMGSNASLIPAPAPSQFNGYFSLFSTAGMLTTREFECDAVYLTRQRSGRLESELILALPSGAVTIPMHSHIIGPGGLVSGGTHGAGGSATSAGRFLRLPPA